MFGQNASLPTTGTSDEEQLSRAITISSFGASLVAKASLLKADLNAFSPAKPILQLEISRTSSVDQSQPVKIICASIFAPSAFIGFLLRLRYFRLAKASAFLFATAYFRA